MQSPSFSHLTFLFLVQGLHRSWVGFVVWSGHGGGLGSVDGRFGSACIGGMGVLEMALMAPMGLTKVWIGEGGLLCLIVGCCVVLSRRGLGLAWLKRSLSCLVGEVLVLRIGRRGLGFAFWLVWVTEWVFFFLLLLNMGFCFGGILVGGGQWWCGGSAVVVTGQWRRCDRGWGKWRRKL